MWKISPKLFMITLLISLFCLIIVYIYKNEIKTLEIKIMEMTGLVTSYLKETISGIEMIKSFSLEKESQMEFESIFKETQDLNYQISVLDNSRESIIKIISTIGTITIYYFGVLEIMNGELSIGVILSYTTLVTYFLSPFINIVNLQTEIQSAGVALDRLGDILFTAKENSKIEYSDTDLDGSLRFENVNFRHSNRKKILKNISFSVNQGEKIGIVGASGSGKTTISKLILNLYQKEDGEIYFGEKSIEDIPLSILRNNISIVSQNSFFFNSTIIDNLTKGNKNISYEDIIKCCQLVGIHDYIDSLPFGYETILSEDGNNLSGGQKQLLSIARSLLRNPKMLVLDEATSNMDVNNQIVIDNLILKLDIICIIIAHKINSVVNLDNIILLNNGEIEATGSHAELMRSSLNYKEIVNNQNIEI